MIVVRIERKCNDQSQNIRHDKQQSTKLYTENYLLSKTKLGKSRNESISCIGREKKNSSSSDNGCTDNEKKASATRRICLNIFHKRRKRGTGRLLHRYMYCIVTYSITIQQIRISQKVCYLHDHLFYSVSVGVTDLFLLYVIMTIEQRHTTVAFVYHRLLVSGYIIQGHKVRKGKPLIIYISLGDEVDRFFI